MSEPVKAKVCWLREEEGGREVPPLGQQYITAVRFEDAIDMWPHEAWSLVIEFNGPIDESLCVLANVRFLVPSAPAKLLHQDSVFYLFEGHRLVARGKVL
jgi:hypothetical protein